MTQETAHVTGNPTTTRVTRGRLADGRELLYFDRDSSSPRMAPDLRDLPSRDSASELRWDPAQREWTVIARHRQARTFQPPVSDCPLCPSRGTARTEIPESSYEVVTFENRFAAFAPPEVFPDPDPLPAAGARLPRYPDQMRTRPGRGRCEVMVFSDDHAGAFSALPASRVQTIIDAWAHRTSELIARPEIAYVYCFENRGDEIGVTLAHPHGQIYGFPFVPPRIEREGAAQRRHRRLRGSCLRCEMAAAEITDGRRIVARSAHWLCYVPFAARWPYEVRLVPRRHIALLSDLAPDERDELAEFYPRQLRRFDLLFGQPAPYIAGWEQAPSGPSGTGWHLSASIFTIRRSADTLKYLAGSESGAAVWISDVAPEAAAAALRGDQA